MHSFYAACGPYCRLWPLLPPASTRGRSGQSSISPRGHSTSQIAARKRRPAMIAMKISPQKGPAVLIRTIRNASEGRGNRITSLYTTSVRQDMRYQLYISLTRSWSSCGWIRREIDTASLRDSTSAATVGSAKVIIDGGNTSNTPPMATGKQYVQHKPPFISMYKE